MRNFVILLRAREWHNANIQKRVGFFLSIVCYLSINVDHEVWTRNGKVKKKTIRCSVTVPSLMDVYNRIYIETLEKINSIVSLATVSLSLSLSLFVKRDLFCICRWFLVSIFFVNPPKNTYLFNPYRKIIYSIQILFCALHLINYENIFESVKIICIYSPTTTKKNPLSM